MFYLSYAGYEIKKWSRDSLTRFLLIYPAILAALGRFVIPLTADRTGWDVTPYNHVILVAIALVTSKITGALAAFSILDDRDDQILYTVRVAPLSFDFFIGLKLLLVYVFSFAGTAFVIWFSHLADLPGTIIISISLLASFSAPLTALLINYLASNKIEGFAAVKSLNVLVLFPIISLFFSDVKEFIFSFEPGFWPAKALSTAILPAGRFQLSFNGYYFAGLIYVIALNAIAYAAFKRKVQ